MKTKYTFITVGERENETPILPEIEEKFVKLSFDKFMECASMFITGSDKDNLLENAKEFCKYDCGNYEEMDQELILKHYIQQNYRTEILIQLEKEYEKENNINVQLNPKVLERRKFQAFTKTIESYTVNA
jgi:hypothetical protein